jgi:hypothetical protein
METSNIHCPLEVNIISSITNTSTAAHCTAVEGRITIVVAMIVRGETELSLV